MSFSQFFSSLVVSLFLFVGVQTQAQTVQVYARIAGINGPVASVPGLSSSNLFALGCAEHQIERVGSATTHAPILITKPLDPSTSPFLRQGMISGTIYSQVELYYLTSSGGSPVHTFTLRLNNAVITKMTTAVDSNGLQETFSLEYGQIIWIDPIGGLSRGWDVVNNLAL